MLGVGIPPVLQHHMSEAHILLISLVSPLLLLFRITLMVEGFSVMGGDKFVLMVIILQDFYLQSLIFIN